MARPKCLMRDFTILNRIIQFCWLTRSHRWGTVPVQEIILISIMTGKRPILYTQRTYVATQLPYIPFTAYYYCRQMYHNRITKIVILNTASKVAPLTMDEPHPSWSWQWMMLLKPRLKLKPYRSSGWLYCPSEMCMAGIIYFIYLFIHLFIYFLNLLWDILSIFCILSDDKSKLVEVMAC